MIGVEVQRLGIGELAIGHNPHVLGCVGLGSCLAIALYHPPRRLGGLAHAMLPRREEFAKTGAANNPAKFVDSAIDALVAALQDLGCPRTQLQAKVVGGAQMFPVLAQRMDIGRRNIEAARERLRALGIPIAAEDTGGSRGRTMYFDLTTGTVEVKYAPGKAGIRI